MTAVFSSTQPSLRARVLPRFPANVLAGSGMSIVKTNGLNYTFSVSDVPVSELAGLESLVNAANDAAAALLSVAVGAVYRNGSVLMVRVA